ncbi:MAG: hypothetical protein P3X23_010050 [Thermosynechococcus sp. Uc]|uniref:hypothetical protein n=1 Tax=Thermosynechococcus sp. Uc TaxID=3034853 RepID=UPI0019FE0660|nr:hypothetical protein [Thermosynechococcus sp. Uc]MDM7327439.1 hypothetical protein [Thermosynechococcus sp. Uc]HIK25741.1 hypothetical protein [Thermosynechococcus sp. M46_R2017_013]
MLSIVTLLSAVTAMEVLGDRLQPNELGDGCLDKIGGVQDSLYQQSRKGDPPWRQSDG